MTWGVTAAAVAATANGLNLSATSRPTQAQVETWIGWCAARASAAVRATGADPDTLALDTSGEGYLLAQQYTTQAAAALTLRAQDRRNTELADALAEDARTLLDDLRRYAAALGDQRADATDTPGLAYAPYMDDTDQAPTQDAAFWSRASGQL